MFAQYSIRDGSGWDPSMGNGLIRTRSEHPTMLVLIKILTMESKSPKNVCYS